MENLYSILKEIENIDANNLFINYIIERVQDDDYRGIHYVQHSRVNYENFNAILSTIYEKSGYQRFDVPLGDCDEDKLDGTPLYRDIVDTINQKTNKGTYNALKKINFPDIARMGFLNRFDRKGNLISESQTIGENKIQRKSPSVYQVQLSPQAKSFLESERISAKRRIYTDGIDALTHNISDELLELLTNNDDFDSINILEFMYILTDDRIQYPFSEKVKLLYEYRKLNNFQKQKVTKLLQKYCNPDKWREYGNKKLFRDYGNWKNESDSIYYYLAQSIYFRRVGDNLCLNNSNAGLFTDLAKRGQKPKDDYYKKHNLQKQNNYHLHHIIPFSKAETQADAQWIDDYKNLICISENKHNEIPTHNNLNIILSYNSPYISLSQQECKSTIITLNLDLKDALVDRNLIAEMACYNEKLLRKFYGLS